MTKGERGRVSEEERKGAGSVRMERRKEARIHADRNVYRTKGASLKNRAAENSVNN